VTAILLTANGTTSLSRFLLIAASMTASSTDTALSYAMIDGQVAIGRYYGFAAGHNGLAWYPRTFMAKDNWSWDAFPQVAGRLHTPEHRATSSLVI
jgi:hypothetical protein